jgi:hypothetical protein
MVRTGIRNPKYLDSELQIPNSVDSIVVAVVAVRDLRAVRDL